MLDAIPSKLFQQWMAFHAEEPFGFEIQNLLSANVAAWVAAGAGVKDVRIEKFKLKFRKSAQQSTRSIMAAARSMACVVVEKAKDDGITGNS